MNRSFSLPDHDKQLSPCFTNQIPSSLCFLVFLTADVCNSPLARFVLLEYSCPSVYLSFILETQTDGKWINKDWAKIGSGCVCSVGHVGCLCTDSQSVSEDWVTERGSKAGRTLMDVMLMSSKPINKLSLPLPSPLISSGLFYTLTGRMRWIQLCCQNLQNRLGCSGSQPKIDLN